MFEVLWAAIRWRTSNLAQGHSLSEAAIVEARKRTASLGPSCAFEMYRWHCEYIWYDNLGVNHNAFILWQFAYIMICYWIPKIKHNQLNTLEKNENYFLFYKNESIDKLYKIKNNKKLSAIIWIKVSFKNSLN